MNTIRAAALDAAICEALRLTPGQTLESLTNLLWCVLRFDLDADEKRQLRHRLQVLQSAGRIEQSSRGRWQIVGGAQ